MHSFFYFFYSFFFTAFLQPPSDAPGFLTREWLMSINGKRARINGDIEGCVKKHDKKIKPPEPPNLECEQSTCGQTRHIIIFPTMDLDASVFYFFIIFFTALPQPTLKAQWHFNGKMTNVRQWKRWRINRNNQGRCKRHYKKIETPEHLNIGFEQFT